LCMRQYPQLCGTERLPDAAMDRIEANPDAAHCIVAWRGAFYLLPLLADTDLVEEEVLTAAIDAILQCRDWAPPMGLLTTLPRARWAALGDGLAEKNTDTLAAIATAAFILCVEGETPPSNEARMSGWLVPGANRWFDKTLQMVVSPDAMIGCVIE